MINKWLAAVLWVASQPSLLLANQAPAIAPVADVIGQEGDAISITVTATDPDNSIPLLSVANAPLGAQFTDNQDGTGDLVWRTRSGDAGVYTDFTFIATDPNNPSFTDSLTITISLAANSQLNVTRKTAQAKLYGVHEIELSGTAPGGNPYDVPVSIVFTPPSGSLNAINVNAFYDGGNLWKARVYITETGNWNWSSTSPQDPAMEALSGTFVAATSSLGGMLRIHPLNPRQFSDDTGKTFLNISDTAYRLFSPDIPFDTFTRFVDDDNSLGISSLRAGGCGGYAGWASSSLTGDGRYERSNWCWNGTDTTQFDLSKFQTTDERLEWLLNNYPGIYVQLILFGKIDNVGPQWFALSSQDRNRIMDYQIARWGAWPQLFYLIVNDTRFVDRPISQAMVREIGNYFASNDPWKHLISAGPKRREPNPFILPSDLSQWHSYIHEEKYSDIDATKVDEYNNLPIHVYYGEDWHEQSATPVLDPVNPDYYMRRIFWSSLLSGGSAAYGGRYPVIHPYQDTGSLVFDINSKTYSSRLSGLDSVNVINLVFQSKNIDLARFTPDDSVVSSPIPVAPLGNSGPSRIQATRKSYAEMLVYLPNAETGEFSGGLENSNEDVSRVLAALDVDRTPQVEVDLVHGINASYVITWFNPETGETLPGGVVTGGSKVSLSAPWTGSDAVLHIATSTVSLSSPLLQTVSNSTGNEAELQMFTVTATDADGTLPDLSATDLPAGASFSDNHDGTGTFSWIPDSLELGSYRVSFIATDALNLDQSDKRIVFISANNANAQPVIQASPTPVIGENTKVDITIIATDVDGSSPILAAQAGTLPAGAILTDNNDGTANLVWTPQTGDALNSPYRITVTATDAGDTQIIDNRTVEIIVFNNLAMAGGPYNGGVGSAINFDGSGSFDLDSDPLSYSWNFGDDSPPGTGVNPAYTYTAQGTYTVTLTVNDGTLNSPVSTATVTVTDIVQQDSNGLISLEVENADANIPRNGFSWAEITSGFYSGGKALQATPTSGPTQDAAGYSLTSPQLDFQVNFSQTGTHYVWLRGIGTQGNANSAHVGLDGMEITSSQNISFPLSTTPVWSNGANIARFDVTTTGTHTINIWMRETGFTIDKLVVTTDASFIPTGLGPVGFYTNQPPVAVAGNLYTGQTGSSIGFTGTASFDIDADPLSYLWDFGDGSPLIANIAPRHIYTNPGNYIATLVVNDGVSDSPPSTAAVVVSGSTSYQEIPRIFTLAHRGGAGERPENTLAAFNRSLTLGTGIEMDIRLSSDGVIVVFHDATVDRTTNSTGNVSDMTLSQLQALDTGSYFNSTYAGETVPTLEEVFILFNSLAATDAFMSIDTKVENAAMYSSLIALLDQYNLFDRVLIEVSSTTVGDAILALDPRVRLAIWRVDDQAIADASNYPDFERIHSPASQVGKFDLVNATDKAFALFVNLTSELSQVQSTPIDGIITDYPELLLPLITNQPATASITTDISNGIAPLVINFDASSSSDADGSIVSWQWDFGDGSVDSGLTVTHTYLNAGTYTTTLTVTDNIGVPTTTLFSIAVLSGSESPVADPGGPYSGVTGSPVSFDGSGSLGPDPDPLSYSWDFGDGSPAGTGVAPAYNYSVAGSYTVTLVVNDGTVNSLPVSSSVTITFPDQDNDGIADSIDNCPADANLDQLDTDNDGLGDVCDSDADGDGLPNSSDPIPLQFNFNDGDLAPLGLPDGVLNAADRLIMTRLVLGMITTTTLELAHGDLYPPGAPDGIINVSDLILLDKQIFQITTP